MQWQKPVPWSNHVWPAFVFKAGAMMTNAISPPPACMGVEGWIAWFWLAASTTAACATTKACKQDLQKCVKADNQLSLFITLNTRAAAAAAHYGPI